MSRRGRTRRIRDKSDGIAPLESPTDVRDAPPMNAPIGVYRVHITCVCVCVCVCRGSGGVERGSSASVSPFSTAELFYVDNLSSPLRSVCYTEPTTTGRTIDRLMMWRNDAGVAPVWNW